jgi:hypothetical protein
MSEQLDGVSSSKLITASTEASAAMTAARSASVLIGRCGLVNREALASLFSATITDQHRS